MKIDKRHCIHIALQTLCAERPTWKRLQRAENPHSGPACVALLCDVTPFELCFLIARAIEEQECGKQDRLTAYHELRHSWVRYVGSHEYMIYWPLIHY